MTEVDALKLRARLEAELDGEAERTAQRIVDDMVREQARAAGSDRDLELTVTPVHGPTRRVAVLPNPDAGAPWVLCEAEKTEGDWSHQGTEGLERVELDGEEWPQSVTSVTETEAGP